VTRRFPSRRSSPKASESGISRPEAWRPEAETRCAPAPSAAVFEPEACAYAGISAAIGCPSRAATGRPKRPSAARLANRSVPEGSAVRIGSGEDSASERNRSSLSDSACCTIRLSRRICASRSSRSRIGQSRRRLPRGMQFCAPAFIARIAVSSSRFSETIRKGMSMSRSLSRESASTAPSPCVATSDSTTSQELLASAPSSSSRVETRSREGSKPPRRSSSYRSPALDAESSTTRARTGTLMSVA